MEPSVCIDCNKCRPECPVEAIYPDYEVPFVWRDWIEVNVKIEPKLCRTPTLNVSN
ncbi:4Fe-4S binding protein [Leptospira sp. Pond_2020]|uniref:4Fe-4S binding protein n=1 Tax=Leptospira sp. Pond_2020 TaxID=2846916 RepID=UPI001E42BB56|nr:4Fe-4S binding protein [Leptospira sp. Pond_2020]